jgi:PhoPQ-activated pathogenicity-related protein
MDDPKSAKMMEIIDPINYLDRLERMPKLVVLTSDDEFMSMDWSQLYWDRLKGEKHLLILENAEHEMVSGIRVLLSTWGTWLRSVAAGKSAESRPSFEQSFD